MGSLSKQMRPTADFSFIKVGVFLSCWYAICKAWSVVEHEMACYRLEWRLFVSLISIPSHIEVIF